MEKSTVSIPNKTIEVIYLQSIWNICKIIHSTLSTQDVSIIHSLVAVLQMKYDDLILYLGKTNHLDFLFVNYYGLKYNTEDIKLVRETLSHGYIQLVKRGGSLFISVDYEKFQQDLKTAINFEIITRDTPLNVKTKEDVGHINKRNTAALEQNQLEFLLDSYRASEEVNFSFHHDQFNINAPPKVVPSMADLRNISDMNTHKPEKRQSLMGYVYRLIVNYRDTFRVLLKVAIILNKCRIELDDDSKLQVDISVSLNNKILPVLK